MAQADLDLGFWDYVKAAFYRKVPMPLLGRMPVNLMALGVLGVLGLANPGFWLLGLAAEMGYLGGVAGSGRFQKLIQGERLLGAQRGWEVELSQAVTRLGTENQERYKRLLEGCRAILGIADKLEAGSLGHLRDMRSRNLNQLLVIFLRLLASQEVISGNLNNLGRGELERNVAQVEKALEQAKGNEPLMRSLEGTLAIQKKRLENLQRAQGNLQLIEAELLRIEQQVELLREEAAVAGSPDLLSQKLDAVTSTMGETTRWMDEHREILGSLGESPLTEVPDMPRLPGMAREG